MKQRTDMKFIDWLWLWPDGVVWRMTRGMTERSRRNRFALFMEALEPKGSDAVLDVGAGEGQGRAVNFFEEWYPWRAKVTAVALEDLPRFRAAYPEVHFVVGDGRELPFRDQAFDVVFSNAVLEHVGTAQDQKQFLSELCRVARRSFVSTPNRWFPVDAHTMIPFAHWLPLRWRNTIYRKLGREYYASEERLRLVGLGELRRLLPPGVKMTVHPQRFLGLVANWNVVLERKGR